MRLLDLIAQSSLVELKCRRIGVAGSARKLFTPRPLRLARGRFDLMYHCIGLRGRRPVERVL